MHKLRNEDNDNNLEDDDSKDKTNGKRGAPICGSRLPNRWGSAMGGRVRHCGGDSTDGDRWWLVIRFRDAVTWKSVIMLLVLILPLWHSLFCVKMRHLVCLPTVFFYPLFRACVCVRSVCTHARDNTFAYTKTCNLLHLVIGRTGSVCDRSWVWRVMVGQERWNFHILFFSQCVDTYLRVPDHWKMSACMCMCVDQKELSRYQRIPINSSNRSTKERLFNSRLTLHPMSVTVIQDDNYISTPSSRKRNRRLWVDVAIIRCDHDTTPVWTNAYTTIPTENWGMPL